MVLAVKWEGRTIVHFMLHLCHAQGRVRAPETPTTLVFVTVGGMDQLVPRRLAHLKLRIQQKMGRVRVSTDTLGAMARNYPTLRALTRRIRSITAGAATCHVTETHRRLLHLLDALQRNAL